MSFAAKSRETRKRDARESRRLKRILAKHKRRNGLIALLEDIQTTYGYLPKEILEALAEKTGRSLVDVYAVATFYKSFTLEPRGKHLVSVCVGTACHVRGAPAVADEFEKQLGVRSGQTTPDGEFTTKTVNCLGACALGPIVVIDGHYFANVRPSKVGETIAKTREGLDKVEVDTDKRVFPIEVRCPRCNHSLMDPSHLIDGHPSVRLTASFEGKHSSVRLSSLYGSPNVECKYDIPVGMVVDLFCRHCHARMVGSSLCGTCQAPMAPLFVYGGGLVQICSRYGCKNHLLDLGDNIVE